MSDAIIEIPRTHNPYTTEGVRRDDDGTPHYASLPPSLIDMLRSHVESRRDQEAVVEVDGRRLTYGDLWNRASRVAGGLRARGLNTGDRVAIRYPAGINWVLTFWGTILADAIPAALNTRWTESEVDFAVADTDVRMTLGPDDELPDGDPYIAEGKQLADTAAFFFTSGTAGFPKAVPITHEMFLTNAENMARVLANPKPSGTELRTLISVPLFHVTGCNSQLLVAAYVGGTAVIMPELDPVRLLQAVTEEEISFLVTVPAVYALLLRNPAFPAEGMSGVRWVGYGGAPIAPSLVQSLRTSFLGAQVFNGYGLTETASLMTCLPDADAVDHADSVGFAMPSIDIGIVPFDDDHSMGELVCRGGNVTPAYWNRPEENEASFQGGWLHTGDVAHIDAAGRVHIVDRIKDIINRGGENVSSIEVEAALLASPGVVDAAVLPVPDDVMGEKVGAVIYGGDEQPDITEVIASCEERLSDFKIPQYVSVADAALPRNAGGKLLKGQLRGNVDWGQPLR